MTVKFLTVGFTLPEAWPAPEKEAAIITLFLDTGALDYFHLRKPAGDFEDYRTLLSYIPEKYHNRIIIDSNPILFQCFGLGGYHLKSKGITPEVPVLPPGIFYTRSLHSLEELNPSPSPVVKYSFLSPVYDSISKIGYKSNFNVEGEDLRNLLENRNIVALGGVKPEYFKQLYDAKFVGAALLGYLWHPELSLQEKIDSILTEKDRLCCNL